MNSMISRGICMLMMLFLSFSAAYTDFSHMGSYDTDLAHLQSEACITTPDNYTEVVLTPVKLSGVNDTLSMGMVLTRTIRKVSCFMVQIMQIPTRCELNVFEYSYPDYSRQTICSSCYMSVVVRYIQMQDGRKRL